MKNTKKLTGGPIALPWNTHALCLDLLSPPCLPGCLIHLGAAQTRRLRRSSLSQPPRTHSSPGRQRSRYDLPRSRGWHPSLPAPPPNTHPWPTQSISTILSVNKSIIPSHFWLPAPSRQPTPCMYKPCLTTFIFPSDTVVGVQLIRILSRFPSVTLPCRSRCRMKAKSLCTKALITTSPGSL